MNFPSLTATHPPAPLYNGLLRGWTRALSLSGHPKCAQRWPPPKKVCFIKLL